MERRRRRRDRACLAGKHGLVVLVVPGVGGAAAGNVGRQRHPARPLEQKLDRFVALEVESKAAIRLPPADDRGDSGVEVDPVALAQPPGVADEGAPGPRPLPLVKGRFDPGLAVYDLRFPRAVNSNNFWQAQVMLRYAY